MAVDKQFIYIRCKKAMYKFNLSDMSQAAHRDILKKDGKARGFTVCGSFIFLWDFCDLYILNKADLQIQNTFRLGTDLSSDIMGAQFDSQKLYVAIRNGKMSVIDMYTKNIDRFDIAGSSFWDYCVAANRIYAGTVRGELLEIDKDSMRVIRKAELSKNKNIYSILPDNGSLYLVSQDRSIKAVDIASFQTLCTAKKAVGNMAQILGKFHDCLAVADSNKVSFWDVQSLQHQYTIDIPTGAWSKGVVLAGNRLIGSDMHSIYSVELK
jgi:hypothetical protein